MTLTKRPTILFVDDDQRALDSYARVLGDTYEVVTALDAKEGLDEINSIHKLTVIISDLKMPGMDGISFLKAAKQIVPDAKRILLTGYADLQSALDAVNKGNIFRLLCKPCPAELLTSAINDALQQQQLEKDSRELHALKKIKHIMNGIVASFTTLVESRDPYTAGHQRRVAELSSVIATAMGYPPDHVDAIRTAGLMHDIGKVYVPSDFLNKPGKLTEVEFAIITQHPIVGADILKDVEFEWPIAKIINQHHERLDGSGYPLGLKGEDILPEARILAVSDVVDAMSSRRPYREALGIEAALEEIDSHCGIRYDEDVVKICIGLFRDKGYTLSKMENNPAQ